MASWTDTRTQQMDKVTGNAIQAYRNWCPSVGIDEKPHQIKGLKWCLYHELVDRPNLGVRGGIIADEMGLGKTILMVGGAGGAFENLFLNFNIYYPLLKELILITQMT